MGLQINDLIVEQTLSASTMTATSLYVGTNSVGGSSSSFNSLSATTLSGGTIYSGTTDLYNIFLTTADGNDITRVQPGSNITTGGTGNNPIVNLVASPSVNNLTFSGTATGNALSATTLSGGTISSGSTNLYSIFAPFGSGVQSVGAVGNLTTGGTASNPTINLAASPSFNNISFSGTATGNALSATTLSGGTIFSGNTNIQNYFTLLTQQNLTKANLSGATFTGTVNAPSLSATTLSGGTILSGSTNLYSIFATNASVVQTNVQPGSNITTGGTATNPIINLVASPSVNSITASGASSFTTLSATTIISGSTNLYQIFARTGNTLTQKSGTISGSTFAGNPKKATVTFATAFANTNYAITITSDTNRTWTWESKTAGSFVINSNANTALPGGNVDWTATEYGEK